MDGCLRVAAPDGPSYLVIWPAEVALQSDGGGPQIIDTTGGAVARVGEQVTLGGGEVKSIAGIERDPRSRLREVPPDHCPGPYWLTSRVLVSTPATATRLTPISPETSRTAGSAATPPGRSTLLDSTRWTLTSLGGERPLDGTTITLDVGSTRLSGFSGCNRYGAEYMAVGEGVLTVTRIGGTTRGCETTALARQEDRYLTVLRYVTTYRLEDGRLQLETGDRCTQTISRWPCPPGGTVLVFTARDTATAPTAAITTATRAGGDAPLLSVAFPQLAPAAGVRGVLTARLEGPPALVAGCLRVAAPDGPSYLAIWPPEVALRTDGGDLRVVDAEGRLVARVGERVALEGGDFRTGIEGLGFDPRMRQVPPARCQGYSWLT